VQPGADDEQTEDGEQAERAEPTGVRALVERNRERFEASQARANELLDRYRDRPLMDATLRVIQRDRECAGSVVGSALAFRLFLFFVPMVLFVVGVTGFLADVVAEDDIRQAGISGTLAAQIDTALSQPSAGRWAATIVGFFGMLTTGRTLSKVMVQASCLAWRLPITRKAPLRVIGAVIGLVVALAIVATAVNRIRQELGVGMTGVSYVAAFAVYGVVYIGLTMLLPRATTDPGALLPGAVLVAATTVGLQAVSQLYLPARFDRASQLYGAVGATIVVLGWFFIIGRVMVLSMAIDAVIYERFGSISQFVFGLPVLRALPRRFPWFRRFFQLDEE
jgi:uncharacterized BrkB/YihY/UPF0761 family membrane protein